MSGSIVILLLRAPDNVGPVVLNEIIANRGLISQGYNSTRMGVELNGGEMVEVTNFEPDPCTYRNEYYYNAGYNRLYRRIYTDNRPADGVIAAYWKPVSE